MIPFTKMHGIGNDFVLIDRIHHPLEEGGLPELSQQICDRRFGVGSDGLILVERGEIAPFRMRMFNPDGSESEMCGNGVRCFAHFLHEKGLTQERVIPVETGAGVLSLELVGGCVRVNMGKARLKRGEIGMTGNPEETFIEQPLSSLPQMNPAASGSGSGDVVLGTAVSMGNPHVVIFVDDVAEVPLEIAGPVIEHHPLFPNRVNVHFVEVVRPDFLIQRTWERGAGATLACGTGACASAVAAFESGRAGRSVTIRLPGGELKIDYQEDGTVFMTGPAETVFEGTWG